MTSKSRVWDRGRYRIQVLVPRMDLPEETPGLFAIFIDWVDISNLSSIYSQAYFCNLFKLYVFAEKTCLNQLANKVMDKLCYIYKGMPSIQLVTPELTKYACTKTANGSS